MAAARCHIGVRAKGYIMQKHNGALEMDTVYGQEQRLFAKMQEEAQMRKRRSQRRRVLMWVLRKL